MMHAQHKMQLGAMKGAMTKMPAQGRLLQDKTVQKNEKTGETTRIKPMPAPAVMRVGRRIV